MIKKLFKFFWKRKIISVVLLLIIAGAIYYFGFRKSKNDVEESKVSLGLVAEELVLSGEIKATEHAKLYFLSSGKISWVGVKEGDLVKKGQALAKLDTTSLNAAFQIAQSNLRAAEANLAEVHDNVKDNDDDEDFATKNLRTAAEVAKDNAYDNFLAAQDALKNSTLVSPFNGVIIYLANSFSGATAIATQVQIEVVNPDTIHFKVLADQTEVVDILEGDKVSIIFDAYQDEEINGEVYDISYSPDPLESGVVYSVKVKLLDLKNGDHVYKIGMTGDAKFILQEKENTLFLPINFVQSDKNGDFVYLDKKLKNKLYINVGLEGEDRVEVYGDGVFEGLVVYD